LTVPLPFHECDRGESDWPCLRRAVGNARERREIHVEWKFGKRFALRRGASRV